MNLHKRLSKTRRYRKIASVLSVLLIVTGVALLGVYAYWYFTGDELVKIDLPINIALENTDVVEEDVTEEEVKAHNVPADQPRYLNLPDLNIKQTRILSVGQNSDGRIGTPVGIFDVGWYNKSGKPGQDNQVVFLDGHNGGPTKDGIFKHLPNLKLGATIQIERGDGTLIDYSVVENYIVPLADFGADKMQRVLTPIDKEETLAIISCTGKWIQAQRLYTDRVVVRAVRID